MKTLIAVTTTEKRKSYQNSIRNSWLQTLDRDKFDLKFVIAGHDDYIDGDFIYVSGEETYSQLIRKTYKMICLVHKCLPQYNSIFKCDDDIFIDTNSFNKIDFSNLDYAGAFLYPLASQYLDSVSKEERDEKIRIIEREHWKKCSIDWHVKKNVYIDLQYAEGSGYYLSSTSINLIVNSDPLLWENTKTNYNSEDTFIGWFLQHSNTSLRIRDFRDKQINYQNCPMDIWQNGILFHPVNHSLMSSLQKLTTFTNRLNFLLSHKSTNDYNLRAGNVYIQQYLTPKTKEFSFLRKDCGVITALDSGHFLGFQMLYYSIKNKVNLMVYDIGLEPYQLDWCHVENINILTVTNPPISKEIFYWQSWIKPHFINQSPYRYTLWIDTDCIVVGDLTPLFESIIQNGLLVMKHEMVIHEPTPEYGRNKEELYTKYPVDTKWKLENYCHAGVFGIDLRVNAKLMQTYQWMVDQAISDIETRNLIGWYDEGALNWSLQKLNFNEDQLETKSEWNKFTMMYFLQDRLDRGRWWNKFISKHRNQLIVDNPVDFIKSIPIESNDVILHYSTDRKYWKFWNGVTCLY